MYKISCQEQSNFQALGYDASAFQWNVYVCVYVLTCLSQEFCKFVCGIFRHMLPKAASGYNAAGHVVQGVLYAEFDPQGQAWPPGHDLAYTMFSIAFDHGSLVCLRGGNSTSGGLRRSGLWKMHASQKYWLFKIYASEAWASNHRLYVRKFKPLLYIGNEHVIFLKIWWNSGSCTLIFCCIHTRKDIYIYIYIFMNVCQSLYNLHSPHPPSMTQGYPIHHTSTIYI